MVERDERERPGESVGGREVQRVDGAQRLSSPITKYYDNRCQMTLKMKVIRLSYNV